MSELALGILRISFLIALWLAVVAIVMALRKDLAAPRDARPQSDKPVIPPGNTNAPPAAPKRAKPARKLPSHLTVTAGPHAGTRIPLTGEPITIGRAPNCSLVLDDDYASSTHARIISTPEGLVVEDLGSTNGTWIGRTRLTQPTRIDLGTEVRIGRSSLVLEK